MAGTTGLVKSFDVVMRTIVVVADMSNWKVGFGTTPSARHIQSDATLTA